MEPKYARRIYLAVLLGIGVWVLSHLREVFSFLGFVTDVTFPILLGLGLAFLLHLPLGFLERLWERSFARKWKKAKRAVCLTLTVLLTAGVFSLFLFFLLPRLFQAASELFATIPEGIDRLWSFAERWSVPLPFDKPDATGWDEMFRNFWEKYGEQLTTASIRAILNAVGGVFDFAVSVALALYVLAQKEKLRHQVSRLLRASVSPQVCERVIKGSALVSKTFSRFFVGQTVEALILSVLCFLGMTLMRMPFALLISVIVGVTALVPIFGAFVGAAVGGVLLLSVNPVRALWFVIFLVVLQQLEDGLIYPRVMGRSVGLPGVWVLSAVIVGSALGLGWVFLSVPTASVIYTLLREYVHEREHKDA